MTFKFLVDECVNADIVLGLREGGVDLLTVKEAGLVGSDDEVVYKFACEKKRVLLTFDRGFGDIFRFSISKSQGVIIVLVGQMSKSEIIKVIFIFLAAIKTDTDLRGKLAILGKTRIRLIRR